MPDKPRRHERARLSRSLLAHPKGAETAFDAAWDFLDVVKELFPREFLGLEQLATEEELEDPALWVEITKRIENWAAERHLSCAAIEGAASRIVFGQGAPGRIGGGMLVKHFDKTGKQIELPSITAEPSHETLDEFVQRAKTHYEAIWAFWEERGLVKRPIKREVDHFRYLAGHLIGGYTWAQIAAGEASELAVNGVPSKSEKTVAGEAREAAGLIGIELTSRRGPRLGSRRRPRQGRR